MDATSFGPCCPQPSSGTYIPEQDEQCLYLNIYKPLVTSNNSPLPVLVWIHGGGHKRGCASERIPILFNGTNIINNAPPDQPVIIVTINYRLGVLADMFLEELIEEDPQWPTAGNYMYLDMLSALRWIQKNIGDYGGDSGNVTIFGQSAGGLSVVDLGAVRGSSGLYRSAIVESGVGAPGTSSSYYNINNALSFSKTIVQNLNCSNEDKEKVLVCIRNASIAQLFHVYADRYTRPIIDQYFFPLYPPSSIHNGSYNNISLIMGHNDFEQPICNQHPDMNLTEAIRTVTENIGTKWAPFVIDYYQLNKCSSDRNANTSRCCNIVRLVLVDKLFECDIRRIFDAFYLKYGSELETNKLFSYHLNCYPQCPIAEYKGICGHSEEVPYVFGLGMNVNILSNENCTWDNQSRIFSNEIIGHWISTAVTGRPQSQWPSYNPSEPKYFHITPDQGFISEIWKRNCSFFDEIEAESVKETFRI